MPVDAPRPLPPPPPAPVNVNSAPRSARRIELHQWPSVAISGNQWHSMALSDSGHQSSSISDETQSDAISHLRRRERRRDRPLQVDHLRDALLLLCRDGAIEPSPQLGHLMRDAINQMRDAIKSHRAQSRVRAPPTAINLMRDAIKGH